MAKGIIETDKFLLFWGGWPSQWTQSEFIIDGITYNCCEQYMMAEKARVFGDEACLKQILAAPNPAKQKALGRKVQNFDAAVWNTVCRGVVYTGNLARFSHSGSLSRTLLATGERTIVEASPVDRIWGIGLAPDDPKAQIISEWRGTNWLGIALMQVRAVLAGIAVNDLDLAAQLQCLKEIRGSVACPRVRSESSVIHEMKGDATVPHGNGPKIIVHVCNDEGLWGRGFVLALSKRWKKPEQEFVAWHKGLRPNEASFELGSVQFAKVESDIWVANIVGQHGIAAKKGVPPIRYDAVEKGLEQVAKFAQKHGATVHMPRIGCGLAGGTWERIGVIVQKALAGVGIEVFVYDLPN